MCGVAGFLNQNSSSEENQNNLVKMLNAINHRGPDGSGVFTDGPLYLGHKRLAIIDLSNKGLQPKQSNSGRYICSYNGEIYNYKEIKLELETEGFLFYSTSDTEVLLSLIEHLGFEKALMRCVGMFSIALWDKKEKTLCLARDRYGEKPLYYGWHKGSFIFASELKALIEHKDFEKRVCIEALNSYFKYNYIEAPQSIFDGTKKLGPGEILCLDASKKLNEGSEKIKKYWSLEETLIHGDENPFLGDYNEAISTLENILDKSVKSQMQADVPLGAFLSGGIDSSLVVALMQKNSANQINTFSIGFSEKDLDEAKYAKFIANHIGTNHEELYISKLDVQNAALKMSNIFDEPFSDSSQLPTYLVSNLAKRKVTVSLSGDGGDELFFGYSKYLLAHKLSKLPKKELLSKILRLFSFFPNFNILNLNKVKKRLDFLSQLINYSDFVQLYELLSSDRFYNKYLIKKKPYTKLSSFPPEVTNRLTQTFMYLDTKRFLTDDILVKVDRTSMSVGLENRVPLLDHRILDFTSSLPFDFFYEKNCQKKILKDILYNYVPKELLDRPKSGFVPPISTWLKNDLKEWATDLLNWEGKQNEFVNLSYARRLYKIHLNNVKNNAIPLWKILMFLDWQRRWL